MVHNAGADTVTDGIQEKLVHVRRTAKVVKGGKIFGFSVLIVVGDLDGKIGYGIASAREVPMAIQKATEQARRNMVRIPLRNKTLYHPVTSRHGASTVIMLPASEGTGVIAGNAMRAVFEVMGVTNVLSKCMGSSNPLNVVRAVVKGLLAMKTPDAVAAKRGRTVAQVMG